MRLQYIADIAAVITEDLASRSIDDGP